MNNMMNQLIIEGTIKEIISNNNDGVAVKIENTHNGNNNIFTVHILKKLIKNNAIDIGNTIRIVGHLLENANNIVICAEYVEYKPINKYENNSYLNEDECNCC